MATKEYNKKYYQENKERMALYNKKRLEDPSFKKEKSDYHKEWYQKNKEKVKAKSKSRYIEKKDEIKVKRKEYEKTDSYRESIKKSTKKNRSKRSKYWNELYHRNPQHRTAHLLRSRLNNAIKRLSKAASTQELLGCSVPELMVYLEKQFQPGMTWENQGKVWHIDHIIPLVKFDLSDKEEQRKACHYSNLQPLFALDNLKKNKF